MLPSVARERWYVVQQRCCERCSHEALFLHPLELWLISVNKYVNELISVLKFCVYTPPYADTLQGFGKCCCPLRSKANPCPDCHVTPVPLCFLFQIHVLDGLGRNTQDRAGRNGQQHAENHCRFRYLLAKWTHDRS